jgi:hypothetical protein
VRNFARWCLSDAVILEAMEGVLYLPELLGVV